MLPPAGRRLYDYTRTDSVGSAGRYWSSNPLDRNQSYNLVFSSSSIYHQSFNERSEGEVVRCFRNTKDIIIEATATAANQTLTINKYFDNAYTVDR